MRCSHLSLPFFWFLKRNLLSCFMFYKLIYSWVVPFYVSPVLTSRVWHLFSLNAPLTARLVSFCPRSVRSLQVPFSSACFWPVLHGRGSAQSPGPHWYSLLLQLDALLRTTFCGLSARRPSVGQAQGALAGGRPRHPPLCIFSPGFDGHPEKESSWFLPGEYEGF